MALLFVLFPRIGPLWGVPQDASAKTGLSNSMSLGAVAELAKDDSVALRLKFEGPPPPLDAMYLRGPVLGNFDGREWRRSESGLARTSRPPPELRVSGPAFRYEMTLEPLRLTTLPLLEMQPAGQELAPRIEGFNVLRREDGQWVTDRPIAERLRFSAQAHLAFQHGPRSFVPALQEFLALPPGFNPRTLAWAQRMRADERYASADAHALAQALLVHIREGGFSYTLEPGTYGRDAIDEFWLDRKAGFCEHFAASFVVVMRAMGVPARVVTGYQGADPMLVDGYMVVRNSYAHAWAEYWQAGIGWVRVDPTSAVAPDRIGASRNLAPRPGLVAGAFSAMSPTLLAQLRDGWEAVNNRWNQWVLSYSRGQQLDLLKRLGMTSPSWEDLAYLLIGALSTLSVIGAALGMVGPEPTRALGAIAVACAARAAGPGHRCRRASSAAQAGASGATAARRGRAFARRVARNAGAAALWAQRVAPSIGCMDAPVSQRAARGGGAARRSSLNALHRADSHCTPR